MFWTVNSKPSKIRPANRGQHTHIEPSVPRNSDWLQRRITNLFDARDALRDHDYSSAAFRPTNTNCTLHEISGPASVLYDLVPVGREYACQYGTVELTNFVPVLRYIIYLAGSWHFASLSLVPLINDENILSAQEIPSE